MSDFPETTEQLTDVSLLKRQLADSRKASAALQQMVDALASLPALEHFVPAALRIVARVFETTDCAYYEHRRSDPIRLRYWFFEGRVFGPKDIRGFDNDHRFSGVRVLEAGFLMPDDYLGTPFRHRTNAQVVSHEGDQPGDEWYDLRKQLNWYTSLNVPLVVGGEADGALLVNRGRGAVFSASEIELAERLGQQLALAMEVDRLASDARHAAEATQQAAVAQERETAAEERAVELASANAVLRSTLDQLSKQHDLQSFPRTILHGAMTYTGAKDGLILLLNGFTGDLEPLDYISIHGLAPHEGFTRPFPARASPSWAALVERRGPVVFTTEQAGPFLPQAIVDWHRERGNRSILATAMFIDGQPYGYFGITLEERAADVSVVKMELIQSLAQHATLAIQLTRLAEASQQAAVMVERQQVVVQERANLAREIHDRLAQGYAAILMQQHTMRRALLRGEIGAVASAPLLAQLDIIERLSRENLAEARRTMDELRVDPFGPGDLAASLERCLHSFNRELDFAVALELDHDLPPLRRYVETELCRIVSEAVTNARKHARSGSVRVCVRRAGDGLEIAIRDEGVGFDMAALGPSFGIASMEERAARAGGRLTIVTAPGSGTEVRVALAS